MTPKLTYFNIKGLAEPIRLLLKYGDIEFEDVRIEKDKWPEIKPTLNAPFGQLPLYEENGKVVAQSVAICRYIAKKVNLVGDNDWEALEIDAFVDTIVDIRTKCVPFFTEQDEEKKEQLKKNLKEEVVPFYMERFDKNVKDGYVVAGKLTWGDVYFTFMAGMLEVIFGAEILENYPNLQGVVKNVTEIPAIKTWIETGPK